MEVAIEMNFIVKEGTCVAHSTDSAYEPDLSFFDHFTLLWCVCMKCESEVTMRVNIMRFTP